MKIKVLLNKSEKSYTYFLTIFYQIKADLLPFAQTIEDNI